MNGPSAFSVRVAYGDIVDVHASLLVIGHVNDVAPTGAEKAIDDLLGGAIGRRMARLRGKLGETWFLPTLTSPVAAGCVVVVSLGDAEDFTPRRLGDVGAAIVDAAATIGARDAATIVHGASNEDVGVRDAARRLLTGVLHARNGIEGGDKLRELTIVERSAESVKDVRRGLDDAATGPSVHVYFSDLEVRRRIHPAAGNAGTPFHLRLGLTRSGPELKITRIGDGGFDPTFVCPYPATESEGIIRDLHRELAEGGADKVKILEGIGDRLWNAFLGVADINAGVHVNDAPGGLVVLRLDAFTADLPWELLRSPDGTFVSRRRLLGRQLELGVPGRAAAFNKPHPRLRALVIGNPSGDLPAAEREAEAVAKALEDRANAEVDTLIGTATYGAVSRFLDGTSYDVLHYAGHAEFVEDRPNESGLKLSDHLLTPGDFAARRYMPRLVVANACHSAAATPQDERTPFEGSLETRSLVGGV
ncbi:MAG: CHAT domain-containing protein, partial [Thermoleophilaceae bacterium]|nr:CHAT domain-containing protein [Thermoleophilaceae bacterium]